MKKVCPAGVTAQVAIKIYGPDLDVLRDTAEEVKQAIAGIEGVEDMYVEPQVMIDQVRVTPRREALAAHGFSVQDVTETIELAMGGEEIAFMQEGQIRYPISVRLRSDQRASLEQLRCVKDIR